MMKTKPAEAWGPPGNPTPAELAKFRIKYPGLPDFMFRRALITENPEPNNIRDEDNAPQDQAHDDQA